MKLHFFIHFGIIILFGLSSCVNVSTQTDGDPQTIKVAPQSSLPPQSQFFVDNIPKGNVKTSIVGLLPKEENPRLQELNKKLTDAAEKDRGWFIEHLKNTPEGKPMEYDERMGITKSEYRELLTILVPNSAGILGDDEITIIEGSGMIQFHSLKNPHILDLLTFDIASGNMKWRDIVLFPTGKISVTNSDHAFQSSWSGFSWKYENISPPDFSNGISCNVSIGKIDSNGQIFLSIRVIENAGGKQVVNFTLANIFQK